ncbi:MAG: thioredoxin-disulfide reductase [Vicinamibacteria bacterium]
MGGHRRVIIIGSGPAAYTAALYAGRAELAPLVLAGSGSDPRVGIPGGQLMITTEVENYPGFPDGVTGPDMMELFRKQAIRFGAEVIYADATGVDLRERPFSVESGSKTYLAETLIIATGAAAKWLGLVSEKKLQNRGVSACATCDGALYRGKEIAVVGGGDTAMEEALFLTRFGTRITVIHRRDQLRASKIMQERAFRNPKIHFVWDSEVVEVLGDKEVEGVKVRNHLTGKESVIVSGALFVAIGHEPRSDLFRGQLDTDDQGYIRVYGGTRTTVEGAFACGDVMDKVYRQAVTAAGTGCMAAIDAERFLAEHETDTRAAVSEVRT